MTVTINGQGPSAFDASGNLGVGTTTPSAKLSLINTGGVSVGQNFRVDEATSGYTLTQSLDDTGVYWSTNSSIRGYRWKVNAVDKMYLSNNGELSVGTNTANGVITATATITDQNGIASAGNGSGHAFYGVSTSGLILNGTTGSLTLASLSSTDSTNSGANFYLYKLSSAPTNNDIVTLIRSFGKTSTGVNAEYSRLQTTATTVTNGSMASVWQLYCQVAGALTSSFQVNGTSAIYGLGAYNTTTANAANQYVDTNGRFYRSTSSIQYKTDIENIDPANSAVIYQMRPVWYRSTTENDRKDWSWYGLIAEEVAEIEPRLVFWGYDADQYDTVLSGPEDQQVQEKVLKKDAVMRPEGVQYDRLTVFLIEEMKKLNARIAELEAK